MPKIAQNIQNSPKQPKPLDINFELEQLVITVYKSRRALVSTDLSRSPAKPESTSMRIKLSLPMPIHSLIVTHCSDSVVWMTIRKRCLSGATIISYLRALTLKKVNSFRGSISLTTDLAFLASFVTFSAIMRGLA